MVLNYKAVCSHSTSIREGPSLCKTLSSTWDTKVHSALAGKAMYTATGHHGTLGANLKMSAL